jgi:hypothetical protein
VEPSGGFGLRIGDTARLRFGARGVDERHEHGEVRGDGDVGAEAAVALAAGDDGFEAGEHSVALGAHLGVWKLGGDGDEGVEGPSSCHVAARRRRSARSRRRSDERTSARTYE